MITDRKPWVFISSTMDELAMERIALKKALEDKGIHVWLYENDAGARPNPIQQTYFEGIADSDIYIGLFWLKYGQYTIDEYEQARKLKKPCLVYVKSIGTERCDERLTDFLQHIRRVTNPQGLTDCHFNTIEVLTGQASKDVERLLVKSGRLVDTQNRERLLSKVRDDWIHGVLEQSLSGKIPIVLGLQQQHNALRNPWSQVVQETGLRPQELRSGTRITEVYEKAEGELLIFGPLFGLIGGLILGPGAVLHFVLSGVISSGLLSALVFGGEACTKHFVLRLLLCLETGVPWNYPQFLDYATERILLRRVGGSYIFIHRLLLEHFVTHREM